MKLADLVELAKVVDEARARRNLKRRVMRARRFPGNTTPASRHLHTIALALVNGERYMMLTEEPVHCGETMLLVLLDLWKTKTELAKLKGRP